MHAAEMYGAELRHGTVVDLARRSSGGVRGVSLAGGEIVEGDAVVIAMGPWSILAAHWLPLPAVLGYKGHSLVFETGGSVPAEALFLEYREASGEILTPELFPRADGTTYVCAISSTGPVPVDPAEVAPERGRARAARSPVSEYFAGACGGADQSTAGVLSTGHRRRASAHRCGSGY